MGWRCHFGWSGKKEGTRVKSPERKGNGAGKSYDVIGAKNSFFGVAENSVFMVSVYKEWLGTWADLFWGPTAPKGLLEPLAGPTLWASCGQTGLDTGRRDGLGDRPEHDVQHFCSHSVARIWSYGPDFTAEEAGKCGPLEFLGRKRGLTKPLDIVCHKSYCMLSSHCNILTIY